MDNSKQKIIKNKRTRRTDAEIKKSIFDAVYQIIKDKGISVLSINLIVEYSKISPLVINKRFRDLNDIIEQFISRWDYWTDLFTENKHQVPTKESYRETLESVLDMIWKKKAIQQILAWQITEDAWSQESTIKEQEAGIKSLLSVIPVKERNRINANNIVSMRCLIYIRHDEVAFETGIPAFWTALFKYKFQTSNDQK